MNQLCVVCQDAPIDHMITPCNHVCLCSGCSTNIKTCPICNGQKGSIIKLFYAGIPDDPAPVVAVAPAPVVAVAPAPVALAVPPKQREHREPVAYRAQPVNWLREESQKLSQSKPEIEIPSIGWFMQVSSEEFREWYGNYFNNMPEQKLINYIDQEPYKINYISKYPYHKKFY